MSECTVCHVKLDEDGMEGFIGLIPFNLCRTCMAGVYDWAMQQWGDSDESD